MCSCSFPGVGEIRAVTAALGDPDGVEVLPLHGSLPAAEQDRALRAGARRRVVLATDLAETSVTVEGVGVVIDAGLARRPSYDPASGLTRLRTIVASRASAEQRAGRAGRLGPGVAYRLWSEAEHATRRPWPDPEIVSTDLAGLALELAVWGAAPGELRWLNPPPPAALEIAQELLEELGATDRGRPTALGRQLSALPLHPRLGAMLLAAPPPARRTAGLLAALLSERDIFRRDGSGTTADVAARLAVLRRNGPAPADVDRAALATVRRRAEELVRRAGRPADDQEDVDPGPLLAAAYPDRIAQARGGGRYRLRHGGGAVLADHDPLAGTAWLVAADVEGGEGGAGTGRRPHPPGRRTRPRRRRAHRRGRHPHRGTPPVGRGLRRSASGHRTHPRRPRPRHISGIRPSGNRHHGRAGRPGRAYRAGRPRLDGIQPGPPGPGRLGPTRPGRRLARRLGSGPGRASERLARLTPCSKATGRADLARIDPSGAIRAALGSRAHELDRMVPTTIELAGGRRLPIDYGGDQPRISAARPRPVRHHHPPDHRRWEGPPHRRAPLPRRPARPSHRRPACFLARILAAGAQGDGRPLPQTHLAREPHQHAAGRRQR